MSPPVTASSQIAEVERALIRRGLEVRSLIGPRHDGYSVRLGGRDGKGRPVVGYGGTLAEAISDALDEHDILHSDVGRGRHEVRSGCSKCGRIGHNAATCGRRAT